MAAAKDIIKTAQIALQDLDGVRWPAYELVGYLNDGQNTLIQARPDQNAVTNPFTPVAGAVQTLPDTVLDLIDIPGNTSGRAMRKVDAKVLDAVDRDWMNMPPSATFVHFCHDTRKPREFLLYPPSKASGASVDLVHSIAPVPVSIPTGLPYSVVTGDIGVPARWANALANYVLARAYDKDAEYGGNAQKSSDYMRAFSAEVGGQAQAANAVKPKT